MNADCTRLRAHESRRKIPRMRIRNILEAAERPGGTRNTENAGLSGLEAVNGEELEANTVEQTPDFWPNVVRQSRFLSAVDLVQADRFRHKVAQEMARLFSAVD